MVVYTNVMKQAKMPAILAIATVTRTTGERTIIMAIMNVIITIVASDVRTLLPFGIDTS
jgi:hypothetical protein